MLRQTKASCLGLGSGLDEGMGGAVVPCALSECEGQCVGQRGAQVGGCGVKLWWVAVVGGTDGCVTSCGVDHSSITGVTRVPHRNDPI